MLSVNLEDRAKDGFSAQLTQILVSPSCLAIYSIAKTKIILAFLTTQCAEQAKQKQQ